MPKTIYKREPIQVNTSAGELIVELVPGSAAYLWIGRRGQEDDEFLDAVSVRAILGAVERSKVKPRSRTKKRAVDA